MGQPGATSGRGYLVWNRGQGRQVADDQWVEAGWSRFDPSAPFATFMKSILRRRPPEKPAGLARCDEDCVERLTSVPIQTRESRRPSVPLTGREGAATWIWAPAHKIRFFGSEAKGNEQALVDKRLSLCGGSFSMLSFGWVISQLCHGWVRARTPTELVHRMGLGPG